MAGLPGVGPVTAERLAHAGLRTIDALVHLIPRRWDDLRQVVAVGALQVGVPQRTRATVERSRVVYFGRRAFEVAFRGDDGAPLHARWFHFRGSMAERFSVGARFVIDGVPRLYKGAMQLVHPETTPVPADEAEASGAIRVRYPEIVDVAARLLEKACRAATERFADQLPDVLPAELLVRRGWPTLSAALRLLHSPSPALSAAEIAALNEGRSPAHTRLAFEELLLWSLAVLGRRALVRREKGVAVLGSRAAKTLVKQLAADLPFVLTGAQRRALDDILADLTSPHPMHRLLHGDVGVGKTAVAWGACRLTVAGGYQAALMAPTELLAEQHARTLLPWAAAAKVRFALLTASTSPGERRAIVTALKSGALDVVCGTHALLGDEVEFHRLALVIVDEQHRFGVEQRAALRNKADTAPHLLVMTATPIPRTLALTLYGDLDVTVIDELLPGRVSPATTLLRGAAGKRQAETALAETLAAGERAYWVCPLVAEGQLDVADAISTAVRLAKLVDAPVGVVHGRLSADDRQTVVEAFRRGDVRLLVATSVIEVGVDVPEATLMVIDGAERFGLAQLHQLRGRVGRGGGGSRCLVIDGSGRNAGEATRARLQALAQTGDGFLLAQLDLQLRGPGELDGLKQAGAALLRHADLVRDADLLVEARAEAEAILAQDPELTAAAHRLLREALVRRKSSGPGDAG